MKTITWKLAMCIIMMLGVFTFSSCGDDEKDDEIILEGGGTYSDLLGTWRMASIDMVEKIDGEIYDSQNNDFTEADGIYAEFRKDGVYIAIIKGGSGQGKWSYKNGQITLSIIDPESGEEDVETGTIKKLTATELEVEISSEEIEDDGSLHEFHSVQTYVKVK
ncbi:lipocalin family protein [Parabacteroides sp.]